MQDCEPDPPTHILVVDGQETRDLLNRSLAGLNYCISEAERGAQAIQIAAAERPDLILLDVMLPDSTGYEVCAQLRRMPECRGSRIAILIGLHNADAQIYSLAAGADEFWIKPINHDTLRSSVRRLLNDTAPAPPKLNLAATV